MARGNWSRTIREWADVDRLKQYAKEASRTIGLILFLRLINFAIARAGLESDPALAWYHEAHTDAIILLLYYILASFVVEATRQFWRSLKPSPEKESAAPTTD